MLQGMNILIMGGDARFLIVMDDLIGNGANVHVIGYDQLTFHQSNIHSHSLDTMDLSKIDAIVLPVSGTNAQGKMEAMYSEEEIYINAEILNQTPMHCIIYSGTTNDFLTQLAEENQRKLVTLFARDDLAIYNSIPTAEGTLKIAIDETDTTIHGAKILVLGFGRVGFTVARLFKNVGAHVHVAARKSTDIARITELGLQPIRLNEVDQQIQDMDICINTIPHLILNKELLDQVSKETLIIDITSAPGGTDFAYAEKVGIKTVHGLGLPGKTAPKTAGKVIGRIINELLEEQYKKQS